MANEQAGGLQAVGDDSKALGAAFQETTGKVGRVLLAGRTQAAGYQAIIRDIALAADAVRPGAWTQDSEQLIGKAIDRAARETGVSRDGLAQAVGRMVSEGMGHEKALELAPQLAKFAVGQKADGGDSGSLMALLDADFGIEAGHMPAVMARIASFGKAEKIDRAELVKVLPVLLRDLKNVGITGEAALAQAQAILKQRMVIDGDAQVATKFLHESLQKLRGKGSEADLKKGRDAIRAYSGNRNDEYGPNAGADVAALERDHAARSGTETSKWARAGHAIERVGLRMGQAVQPLTTYAADKVGTVANGAADMVEKHPLLAAGAATAAAGYGLYRSGKTIGSALGLFGGKGKDGSDGVQKVEVTNWPNGIGMAGAAPNVPGGPEGSGRGGRGPRTGASPRPRTWLGRIGGSLRSAGSGLAGIARGAWAGRAAIAAGAKPLLRFGVPGLTALYTAGELAATLSGGSALQKRKAYAGAAAEFAGGLIGGFVGGPVGLAVGPWLGRMASDYLVDKLAGTAPAPSGKPAAAGAAAAGVAQASAVMQGAALPLPVLPSGQSGMVALPRAPAYMEQLFAYQRGLPGAAVLAPVAGAAALSATSPAPAMAAVAMAGKGSGARASAAIPTDAAREGALQAAVSAAAAPSAQAPSRPSGAAAMAQPAQINFKPSISVTVQGDVREPRRIAEELMPYLRQLFDQFQGQQQRSSLFDAPLTAGGIAT